MSTRRQAAAGVARAGDLGRRLPENPLITARDVTPSSCGHVPLDDRGERIRLYYGAADTCVAAADFQVADILASLERV